MQQARDSIKTGKLGRVATITIDQPPMSVADHAYFGPGLLQFLKELKLHNESVQDSAASDAIPSRIGWPIALNQVRRTEDWQ